MMRSNSDGDCMVDDDTPDGHRQLIGTPTSPLASQPHDASAVETRGKSKTTPLRRQCGTRGAPGTPYDAGAGKLHPCSKLKTQPTPSYAYDPNAAIWARNTMPIRDKTSNRYDASSGQSTMAEKDVTWNCGRDGCLTVVQKFHPAARRLRSSSSHQSSPRFGK